jgi:amino acid adenylation domain-containing protein
MWVLQQMEPEGTAYNMPSALRMTGLFDPDALRAALSRLVARHEAFRTSFHLEGGEPMQRIAPTVQVDIDEVGFEHVAAGAREDAARQWLQEAAQHPFELSRAPLLRVALLRLGVADHVLMFLMHHAIGDQWSAGVLAREFSELYHARLHAREPELRPLRIQYADYAAWQREHLGGDALDGQMAYWRDRLAGLSRLSLPTDHPRSVRQGSRGAYLRLPIPVETLSALKTLSASFDATVFITLLAAFKVLLSRYSAQDDIAVGSPVANRTRFDTEDLVGTMVNTLVMRTDMSGDPTFVELLQRVRDTALQAYEHQDLPFERLVDELHPQREVGQSPLVQVLFNLPNAPWKRPAFEDLVLDPFDFDRGAAQFDLSVTVDPEYYSRLHIEYASELYEAATIERMGRHYVNLLAQVAADASRPISTLQLLTSGEWQCAVRDWNRTSLALPDVHRVDQLITAQAGRTPLAVAVGMGERQLSYADLDLRSSWLASHLAGLGLGRGSLVGVCMERSPELMVALVGVMKAGAAYVPLDPAFPAQRLEYMVHDSGLTAILTDSTLRADSPFEGVLRVELDRLGKAPVPRGGEPSDPAVGEDLAYVLYTSGSTGRPKGVEIRHRALLNFLVSMRGQPGCETHDMLLSVTTLSFDISALELYLPLIVGARVEMAAQHEVNDAPALLNRMRKCRPTLMQATPATWNMLVDAGWAGDPRLVVLCGGEALTSELAGKLLGRCKALWNLYGPTETTVWSSLQRIASASDISIGRPIANTTMYVLDRARQPAPVGVPGEIFIGGMGVGRGYRNRPELTEQGFVADPFSTDPSARLYRTGDLGRYLPDGRIAHMGRTDFQVKIRGYRIELGEIESVLAAHRSVARCAVATKTDAVGSQRIVAYVVPHAGHTAAVADLRAHLRQSLPDYMLPSAFVTMVALPLTANNKVDVKALPHPAPASESSQRPTTEPRGTIAVQLTAMWRSVLADDSVGVNDDFFERGGHSLKAVQLLTMIERTFGRRLPLATLIEAPTVARMELALRTPGWTPPWRSLVSISGEGRKPPLFAVPGVGGNVLVFTKLAALLGPERPMFGLQARGLDGVEPPLASIEAMATHYVAEVRSVQPAGPYLISGTCTGGVVAYEMAQQLRRQGQQVALAIIESWHPNSYRSIGPTSGPLRVVSFFASKAMSYLRTLSSLPLRQWPDFARKKLRLAAFALDGGLEGTLASSSYFAENVVLSTLKAVKRYRPQPFPGRVLNVIAERRPIHGTTDTRRSWEELAAEGSRTVLLPAEDSGRLFLPPHVEELAGLLAGFAARELDGK